MLPAEFIFDKICQVKNVMKCYCGNATFNYVSITFVLSIVTVSILTIEFKCWYTFSPTLKLYFQHANCMYMDSI